MNLCAFTICTKSYIGLATTLKKSFLKYNPNFDFYFIIVDPIDDLIFDQTNIIQAKKIMGISEVEFYQMAFKYNVTEFCTSIKPFGFEYFFNKGYKLVSYFDPDIYFYDKFSELYEYKNISVFLTPHILNMKLAGSGECTEENFLKYGIYNCGFIAFINNENTKTFITWWKKKDNI